MPTFFKYPRALVRNAAKLEQLQNKIFLPIHFRLENIFGVTNFSHLGIEEHTIQISSDEGTYIHDVRFSGNVSGPLQPASGPNHLNDIVAESTNIFGVGGAVDEKFGLILPVLLRNAKEHEPEIIGAWERFDAAFTATLERLKAEAEAIAQDLRTRYKAAEVWGAKDGKPYINYLYLALAILRWRLGIPYGAEVQLRPENGEFSFGHKTAGQRLGELLAPLAEELNAARGKVTLREKYAPVMRAHEEAAHAIIDSLREVLALVPGENAPLEYDAREGLLTFGDKQTRFYAGGAMRAVFDHLVLYRSASKQELSEIQTLVSSKKKVGKAAGPRRAKEEDVPDAKEILRTALRDLDKKLVDSGIPLRIISTKLECRLSRTVDLVQVQTDS